MPKKALIVIAAVAVMLVGATSAYGYEEAWEGWFNSGHLTFLQGPYFDYVEGEGVLRDYTAGSVDSFLVPIVTPSTFTCAASGPYEGWTIKLWPDARGCKDTGQRGQKEVNPGATWLGKAILIIPHEYPDPPDTVEFDVVGTWNTTVEEGDCFNYGGLPPIYSAHWDVDHSYPAGIDGDGGSAGERVYFEE